MRFVDHPGISKLFPAYLRHKDKWDEFKGKWLTARQLESIIKGNIDYNWYKSNGESQIDYQTDNEKDTDKKDINIIE